jgi:hypothetical protein
MADSLQDGSQHDASVDDHDGTEYQPKACCERCRCGASTSRIVGVPEIFPPPSGVHSECLICELSYYTVDLQQRAVAVLSPSSITKFYDAYAGQYTNEDVQGDICAALWQTNKDLDYVKCVLKTHGDLILSRWTKKSKDKRGTLLSSEASVCFGQWPCQSSRTAKEFLTRSSRTPPQLPTFAGITWSML